MAVTSATNVIQFPMTYGATDAEEGSDKYLSVSKLKTRLEDYLGSKDAENREAQESDRYFHSVQWTDAEKAVLKARNQPEITFNRIKRKINVITGVLEKARQEPKGFPLKPGPGAQDGAELATKVLQNLVGWDWQEKSSQIARRGAIRAIAGVELVVEPNSTGDYDIELDEVDQRDFFYDAKSVKADFSDARDMGTTRWVDVDEVNLKWPDTAEEVQGFVEHSPDNWDRGDTRGINWFNKNKDQIRLVDHWYRRGEQWCYCIYAGSVKLEEGHSPFRDHKGKSIPKFIMFSCDVDHDGDRYGFVRDWKGPQDEINHRRSKALHLLNSRRVIAERGAFEDVEEARRELARSDGVTLRNKGYEVEIENNREDAQGNLEMLQEAKNEIDTYGPNPGLIGSEVDPSSGRAIKLLQAAGIAELGSFMLTFRHWKLRVYRALWCACQQFWQAERWISVTDQEGMAEFIQINGWQQDEFGFPVIINQLAQLDVDIRLDEEGDGITSMEDTFDILVNLGKGGIQVPPEVLLELSALPSSTKKRVMQMLQQAAQPSPIDQRALQLKLEEVQAKIQELQASALLKQAQAVAAGTPEAGQPVQIDTAADLAKAELDLAKAQEIHHKIQGGQTNMFELAAKAAETDLKRAQAVKTSVEASNLQRHGSMQPAMIKKEPTGV